jgi:stage V sporulation protein B
MAESPKNQNFLQGAAWLAMAAAVVKLIGALYKIPLKMVIGDAGYGYFVTAYDIYSVLLMISTAGLPVAMSRMVSQANTLGHYRQVRRIYTTARTIFLTLGFISSSLMVVFCHQLAAFQRQPDAWFAILCLGPCAFLVCRMSSYRGFFQGQGNMRPTSISQILEAVCKLVVGLGAAIALTYLTHNVSFAAGGAILGVTFSCLFSALFLFSKFHPAYKALPDSAEKEDSFLVTAKRLLAIAVPITIGSAGLQFLTVVETNLYMGQLLGPLGMTQEIADVTRGI